MDDCFTKENELLQLVRVFFQGNRPVQGVNEGGFDAVADAFASVRDFVRLDHHSGKDDNTHSSRICRLRYLYRV
jgi:hypothetical protein